MDILFFYFAFVYLIPKTTKFKSRPLIAKQHSFFWMNIQPNTSSRFGIIFRALTHHLHGEEIRILQAMRILRLLVMTQFELPNKAVQKTDSIF